MSDYEEDEFSFDDWHCAQCGELLTAEGYCLECDFPVEYWDDFDFEESPEPLETDDTPDWNDESNNLFQYGDIPF